MAQKRLDRVNLLHYNNSSKGCHEKLRQFLKPVKNRKVIANVIPEGYIGPTIRNELFNSVHAFKYTEEPLNIPKWKNVENHCYLRSYLHDPIPSEQDFDQNDSEFEAKDEHVDRLLTAVLMPETQMISSYNPNNISKRSLMPKPLVDDDIILQHAKLLADEAYAKLILDPVVQCMLNREPGRLMQQKSADILKEMNYEWAKRPILSNTKKIKPDLVDRTRLQHRSRNLGYTKHPDARCSSKKCGISIPVRNTLSIIENASQNLPPTRIGKWTKAVFGQTTKNRHQIGETCKRHSLRLTTKSKRIPHGWGFSWSDEAICKKQVNRRPLPSRKKYSRDEVAKRSLTKRDP